MAYKYRETMATYEKLAKYVYSTYFVELPKLSALTKTEYERAYVSDTLVVKVFENPLTMYVRMYDNGILMDSLTFDGTRLTTWTRSKEDTYDCIRDAIMNNFDFALPERPTFGRFFAEERKIVVKNTDEGIEACVYEKGNKPVFYVQKDSRSESLITSVEL